MAQRPGREKQKQRTRNAIVVAARELVIQGLLPSVADVAEAALVSLATAYRYFPDQLSLLRAALADTLPPAAGISVPLADVTVEPAERVAHATRAFLRLILKQEALVRAVMALSLLRSVETPASRQEAVALRPGYRLPWIAEALAPLEGRLDPAALRQLTNALAIVISSEALIALQDVRGLDADTAVEVCVWTARILVQAVVDDHTDAPSPPLA